MKVFFTVLLSSLLYFTVANAQEPQVEQDKVLTAGFDHIGLTVKDLDASTRFFVEVLGWQLKFEDKKYPASFVGDGNMFVTLWQVDEASKAVEFNRKKNVGLHHLAISVKSFEALDALYKKFKAQPDVVIEFAPELSYGGPAKHMMIREPSGNRLEFKYSPR